MKIGIFAYNFEHKKTQEGLLNLFFQGYKVECILAADLVKLNFYQSQNILNKLIAPKHQNICADHGRRHGVRVRIGCGRFESMVWGVEGDENAAFYPDHSFPGLWVCQNFSTNHPNANPGKPGNEFHIILLLPGAARCFHAPLLPHWLKLGHPDSPMN